MLSASPITWLERQGPAVSLAGLIQPAREVGNVANIKSQKKRILTNAKAAERNKAVKSELKTRSKNAVAAIGSETSEESMRLAVFAAHDQRRTELAVGEELAETTLRLGEVAEVEADEADAEGDLGIGIG